MKFSVAAAVVALATSVVALPQGPDGHHDKGSSHVKFPVRDEVTLKQASDKCGDQAQLSCCNKATYAGDSTEIDKGILAGALSNLIGSGSGSEGLGLFNECSKLNVAAVIGVQDLINQQCKQNIACCQKSPSQANGNLVGVGLPCVALGSIL
ncbi:fungal hydrophobin [Aspergillus egyptiacus]|nr:fungal hydrophobin [Aspergillus egyptiacus]